MDTYRVIGMSTDPDVGDGAIPNLLDGRVFVGGTTRVGGMVDGVGNTVDEPNHCVLPITDMITEPQTEDT